MDLSKIICCPACKRSFEQKEYYCSNCKIQYESQNDQPFLLDKEIYDSSLPCTDPITLKKRYEVQLFNGDINDYMESIEVASDPFNPVLEKERQWLDYTIKAIEPKHIMLDIGGRSARKINNRNAPLPQTVIIDIAADEMNRNNFNISKVIADCEELPFQDNSFDHVLVDSVFHHVPRQRLAVKEVYRVLKPGGSAFFLEPAKWSVALLYFWIKKFVYSIFGDWGLKKIGYHGSRYESFLDSKHVKNIFGRSNIAYLEKSSPIRLPFVKGSKNPKLYIKLAEILEHSFINTLFGSYIFIHVKKDSKA